MNIPKTCDVVVIGGGPSGSTVSTLLAQKGYDVVLFDSVRHPRPVVGESLLPHIWKFLDLVGATEEVEREGFITKSGGITNWNGKIRLLTFSDFGYKRPGMHVERDRFDYILLNNARNKGAQVFEEVLVSKVNLQDDGTATGVTWKTTGGEESGELNARYVVDASGQKAVLSRQLGVRKIDEDFRFVSLWGYHKNSKYIAADGRAHPFSDLPDVKPTTFVSSPGDWGWAWHIPLRESTSIGLIIPLEDFKKAKVDDSGLESFYLKTVRSDPYLSALLEDAEYIPGHFGVIRDYSYVPTKLSGPGFFIIGDAAAFVDPVFSLGCLLGMYAGTCAAWAIDRCLKKPGHEADYQQIFNTQYSGFYEVARAMALPGSATGEHTLEMARKHVNFQTSTEQQLMYTAALLTVRESNFNTIAGFTEKEHQLWDKAKLLDEIHF